MTTCFVHHCCLLPQFFSDQSSHIALVAIWEAIVSLLVFKPHVVDAKPYLTYSLSNYYYANLHGLLIKSIVSYHLLWHPIFCLRHSCRFICAKIKYFLSLAFYLCCIFSAYLQKKLKRLRACLVHLLLLVRLVCLPRVA
jgi:hypothetical protein